MRISTRPILLVKFIKFSNDIIFMINKKEIDVKISEFEYRLGINQATINCSLNLYPENIGTKLLSNASLFYHDFGQLVVPDSWLKDFPNKYYRKAQVFKFGRYIGKKKISPIEDIEDGYTGPNSVGTYGIPGHYRMIFEPLPYCKISSFSRARDHLDLFILKERKGQLLATLDQLMDFIKPDVMKAIHILKSEYLARFINGTPIRFTPEPPFASEIIKAVV